MLKNPDTRMLMSGIGIATVNLCYPRTEPLNG
jgi:hypothetical protein